jgi:hypothetical protein
MSANTQIPPSPDAVQIARAIKTLHPTEGIVELRAIYKGGRKRIDAGYFDCAHRDKLATEAIRLNKKGAAVYATLNPLDPQLLARYANRIEEYASATATDANVIRRSWLLIDMDAQRPKDTSATDEQLVLALERGKTVCDYLTTRGWPQPVSADSGNGMHLLYAIDLPNDDDSRDLIQNCLRALAARFDDKAVKVDTSVFNAARIVKLHGTIANKGDHLAVAPWRPSKLTEIPDTIERVSLELLHALASEALQPARTLNGSGARSASAWSESDVNTFLVRGDIEAVGPDTHDGVLRWKLKHCPFNSDHGFGEAAVFLRSDGRLGFECRHNSCQDKHWADLRTLVDGSREERSRSARAPNRSVNDADPVGPPDSDDVPQLGIDDIPFAPADVPDREEQQDATDPPKGEIFNVEILWPTPADLWAPLSAVPPLPRGILPETLEAFAFSKASTFSPSALGAAALATCSMATSDHIRAVINQTWRERFCVWVALVGSSSAAKTPTTSAALRPLSAAQALEFERYEKDLEKWERSLKAAKRDGQEFDDPKPFPVRYYTHSATIEAMSEILKRTEHGIGLTHDELSALIAGMDGPYKEKSSGERGHWLSLYDGGIHLIDRIGRGEVVVKNHSASLLGGITIDKLRGLVSKMAADGLMSRMSIICLPPAEPSDDLGAIASEIYQAYSALVTRLLSSRPGRAIDVPLDESAIATLGAAKRRWQSEALSHADTLPRYAERLGKATGLAARIALGFAIIEAAEVPGHGRAEVDPPRRVDRSHVERATAWIDHQLAHDLSFYADAAGQDASPVTGTAQSVADWALRHERGEFRLGDITRGILEWRKLKAAEQFAALELLDALGWIRSDEAAYFRGQGFVRGVTWSVNPKVHGLFASRAVLARKSAAERKARLESAVAGGKL